MGNPHYHTALDRQPDERGANVRDEPPYYEEDVEKLRELADRWTVGQELNCRDVKSICRILLYLFDQKEADDSYEREQAERL